MKKILKYGMLLACMTLLMGSVLGVKAAYPAVLSKTSPIQGYPIRKTKKVVIYKDSSLTQEKKTVSYRSFTISKQSGNAVYVTCKYGSKKVRGWVKKNTFFLSRKTSATQSYANRDLTLYKYKSTSKPFRVIPMYSGGATIGKSGSWYQTLFYTGGRYYLGWIPAASYGDVRLSMDTTEQILADGYYTISSRKKKNSLMTSFGEGAKARLEKVTEGEEQIFRLKHVKDNCYTITTFAGDGYLALREGYLIVSTEETYWYLERNGSYISMQEANTDMGVAYVKRKGLLEKEWNKKSSYQNWRFTKTEVEEQDEEKNTVFSQYDPKWGGSTYCEGNPVRTISTSGCGVVSLVNAIYALNGQYISPVKLANYSNSNGHYYYMQGTADTLYEAFAKDYGKTYRFKWDSKVTDFVSLKDHLQNGGTAVALVPGHYIAIVDYNEKDNTYLVLDSAITGTRPTTIHGDWISQGALQSGSLYCYYFHLFSRIK